MTRIVSVLVPRFNMLCLVSLLEPLRIANYLAQEPSYSFEFCSADGKDATASNGMPVSCQPLPEKLERDSMILLVGSWGAEHYDNPALLSWLRKQERLGVHLCAAEMAPYIFARAGLLNNRKATTHWAYLPGFQELFPKVRGVEQMYTIDGRIMTCAGSTGGIDFMLHHIRKEHGEILTREVSDIIMHPILREQDAPQRKSLGRSLDELPDVVGAAIKMIEENISDPPQVPEIAEAVGLSQRQLERRFNSSVGCSVVQFGLLMRLQHARVLLVSTTLAVRDVATASGFNSLSHFAYAFRNCFGRRPSDYRQAWPEGMEVPSWPGSLSKYLETLGVNQRLRAQNAGKAFDEDLTRSATLDKT